MSHSKSEQLFVIVQSRFVNHAGVLLSFTLFLSTSSWNARESVCLAWPCLEKLLRLLEMQNKYFSTHFILSTFCFIQLFVLFLTTLRLECH